MMHGNLLSTILAGTLLLASATEAGCQGLAPRSLSGTHAIRAGLLVDPTDGVARADQTILIENGLVTAVGAEIQLPDGIHVIDLSDKTVLPGLIDAHVHLTEHVPQGSSPGGWVTNTPMARRALVGVQLARETLLAGFTTVRDIGNSGNYVDTELRDAVAAGTVWGPTIVTAGKIIAPYGAQSQLNPERPELGEVEYIFADTRDEMVRAVRQNVHFGAQVIKIVIDDQEYLYSADDVRIIVEEAARSGRKVSAHVLTENGARNAVEGGVASLEHAWRMSDEVLDLARENGVVIVTSDFTVSAMRAYGWPDSTIDSFRELLVDRMRRAFARNVEIVFGSDLIWASEVWDRGTWAMEQLDSFTEAGATPLQILRATTINSARLLDVADQRGRIAEGYAADIIAVDGNPLDDISALKAVSFVMKDGRVATPGT